MGAAGLLLVVACGATLLRPLPHRSAYSAAPATVQNELIRASACVNIRARGSCIVATEQPLLDKAKAWWSGLGEFVDAFMPPPLPKDPLPEAVEFYAAIESTKLNPQPSDWSLLANLSSSYYRASWTRTMENPSVKERLPDVFVAVNGVVVLLILRLLLPRLFAIQSMSDLYEFAPELGLPSREELFQYVRMADEMNFGTKLLGFLAIILVEKLTLVGEARNSRARLRPTFAPEPISPSPLTGSLAHSPACLCGMCWRPRVCAVPTNRDRAARDLAIALWRRTPGDAGLGGVRDRRLERQLRPRTDLPPPARSAA